MRTQIFKFNAMFSDGTMDLQRNPKMNVWKYNHFLPLTFRNVGRYYVFINYSIKQTSFKGGMKVQKQCQATETAFTVLTSIADIHTSTKMSPKIKIHINTLS